MSETLLVYWAKSLIGYLRYENNKNFVFQYAPEWLSNPEAFPLSIRMGLKAEPYPDQVCRLFFANLLPEGSVRTYVAQKLGVSESNDFALLKELGRECAGAVSLFPEDEPPSGNGDYVPLSTQELSGMIRDMEKIPLLFPRQEIRLSLAGAQQKLPVYIEDEKIYLPVSGAPSSHILKPQIADIEAAVENEAFCMALAGNCGLPVPKSFIFTKIEHSVYFIERYDRKKNEQGKLVRIHQEDFCQALGLGYSQKYEFEGGPSLAKCFTLLSESGTQPAIDKNYTLLWVFFNYLIGNCDAHAKNISLLITKKDYRLAPFYDLLSTQIYPRLSRNLAMKIGGQNDPNYVTRKNWERLATDAGMSFIAIAATGKEIAGKLPDVAATLANEFYARYGNQETVDKINKNIALMTGRLISSLS